MNAQELLAARIVFSSTTQIPDVTNGLAKIWMMIIGEGKVADSTSVHTAERDTFQSSLCSENDRSL